MCMKTIDGGDHGYHRYCVGFVRGYVVSWRMSFLFADTGYIVGWYNGFKVTLSMVGIPGLTKSSRIINGTVLIFLVGRQAIWLDGDN